MSPTRICHQHANCHQPYVTNYICDQLAFFSPIPLLSPILLLSSSRLFSPTISQLTNTQFACIFLPLKAELGDKGHVLDRLNAERDKVESSETENRDLRKKFYVLKEESEEMRRKMSIFDADANSPVDAAEIEEALVLIRQRKEGATESTTLSLDFLQKVSFTIYGISSINFLSFSRLKEQQCLICILLHMKLDRVLL